MARLVLFGGRRVPAVTDHDVPQQDSDHAATALADMLARSGG